MTTSFTSGTTRRPEWQQFPYWLRALSEIKNRGVADACMLVCDGLKGLSEAVSTV